MTSYSKCAPHFGHQYKTLAFLAFVVSVSLFFLQLTTAAIPPMAQQDTPAATVQEKPATNGVFSESVESIPSPAQSEPASSTSEATPNSQLPAASIETADAETADVEEQTIKISDSWKRLGKNEIWIDFKQKQVMLGGNICLTAGGLEMFVCPANTKEHESVIAANAKASELHAALVALGAEPGKPCQWDPEYKPATGPIIDINIAWHDPATKQTITRPARDMIRNFRTKKPMTQQWVFGGSEIWEDPATGDKVYYANSGEMICVSNFSTATLDLNVESSQSNDGLLFEAFSENIPPLGTKVYIILKPGDRIEAK